MGGALVLLDPEGLVCLICFNLYRLLGLDQLYESIKKYLEWCETDPSRHNGFMSALTKFIENHNANPDSARVKNASDVKIVSDVSAKQMVGSLVANPKKVFVEMADYVEL